jgi:hypothetical protein
VSALNGGHATSLPSVSVQVYRIPIMLLGERFDAEMANMCIHSVQVARVDVGEHCVIGWSVWLLWAVWCELRGSCVRQAIAQDLHGWGGVGAGGGPLLLH